MEWHPLWLSVEVAAMATCVSTVLGVAIATLLAWRPFPGRELIDALCTAPLVLPPTVLGYYLLVSMGTESAIGRAYHWLTGDTIVFTVTGCVVAATIGGLPLVIKSARAALEGVDPNLVKAARTLGAGPVRAFFTVRLPLAARGLLAGLMLAFAKGMGEFGITLMIAGDIPGETRTAPLAIYNHWQAREDVQASGMAAILTALGVLILWGVNHLTNRRSAS
ncbi:MAG TPA: molybdate ABC transporter permease subunit [Kofleriaceae bacterium]|nr:molybdate ABC transporter permease subunit [Kofleriaceae bacterium]